jgi:solute carrier family 25 (mitochondrial carnitine/acylcarnitine transporter), member 20/29
VTTVNGNKLLITTKSSNETKIANATVLRPDLYASNGVVHLVSSLLIPPGAFQLTPEKYLVALNCTYFVSLLRSESLSSLVNSTNAAYTILAPRDDIFALSGNGSLPDKGSDELKKLLKYHFLPGRLMPKKLSDGMLVETALDEPGLNGKAQVLHVGVTDKGNNRELTFGDASVIGGEPCKDFFPLVCTHTDVYI